MALTANAIERTQGDAEITYTITVKRNGTAEDLSAPKTVTFYARDDAKDTTSNQINGGACTLTDAANGVLTYTFTAANLTIAGSDTDFKGKWRLKIVEGSEIEWTRRETFLIERNEMA